MHNYEGIEKREFIRVRYDASIRVKVFTEDKLNQIDACYAKNISAGGILFESKEILDVGTLLVLNLDISTLSNVIEMDDSIVQVKDKIVARVVRIEEFDNKYDIGVCFLRKESRHERKITKIINLIEV